MPPGDILRLLRDITDPGSGFSRIDIDSIRQAVDAVSMTTEDQIARDIAAIRDRLDKLSVIIDRQAERMDLVERFIDQTKGALTLTKFVVGLIGFGGIAAIIWLLSQAGRVAP